EYSQAILQKESTFMQSTRDAGFVDETILITTINANTLNLNAPAITAELGVGGLASGVGDAEAIAEQAAEPWLGYLTQIPDQNIVLVRENDREWNDHSKGLNQTGAIIITAIVTVATAGTGLGASLAATAGFAGSSTAAAISTAAITNLSTTSISSAISGDFDAGRAARSFSTAIATAGVTSGIGTYIEPGFGATIPFANRAVDIGVNTTVASAIDSLVYQTEFDPGSVLKSALISIGASEAAFQVGEAKYNNQITTTEQLAFHAAIGCAAGYAAGGDCGGGVAGAVTGEITSKAYIDAGGTNPTIATNLAGIAGAVSSLATSGDAQIAAQIAQNAAEYNAVQVLVALAAAGVTAYTDYAGDGELEQGLASIGQGNDPVSQVLGDATAEVVHFSYDQAPQSTEAVLNALGTVGEGVDAVITFIDDSTGKTVSEAWNSLGASTQDKIKGGGKIVSIILPVASGGKLAQATNIDLPNSQTLGTFITDESGAFYFSREARDAFEQQYGKENVVSKTVPPINAPNVKLAGKRHPKTKVSFDNKGFPIFDQYIKHDVRLDLDTYYGMTPNQQMRAATQQLKEAIDSGKVDSKQFNHKQLQQIHAGSAQIDEFTWHHHQDGGRLQLIDRDIHDKTSHIGGTAIQGGR
ncbi:MAG: HNH endonuclease, partial [Cyanobacteria bacterium P01_D01_bin.56]